MHAKRQRDELDLGSAPSEERCAQVGSEGYHWRAWHECRSLVRQLRRTISPEPPGARLYVKENPHNSGTYLSVACSWPSNDEPGRAYAHRCEAEMPAFWDDDARAELGLPDPAPQAQSDATGGAKPKARAAKPRKAKGGQAR